MSEMKRPETAEGAFAILTPDQIAMLWDRGFTVIPRDLFGRDPYAIADAIKRPGMAQQWCDAARRQEYLAQGWRPVKNDDWPGLFVQHHEASNTANAEVSIGGLILMQQPQHKVDQANAANHAKAHQNVDDWYARQSAAGFSVETRTVYPDGKTEQRTEGDQSVFHRDVDGAKTIDTTVGISRDLMPYVKDILAERDALCQEAVNGEHDDIVTAYDQALKENPHAPKWPTLRAIAMPKAIERIRAKLKAQEGTDDGGEAKGDQSNTTSTTGDDSVVGDADRGHGAAGAGDASGSGGGGAAELGAVSEPDGGARGDGGTSGPSSGIGSEPSAAPADQSSDQS